jgi:hypothetical protein
VQEALVVLVVLDRLVAMEVMVEIHFLELIYLPMAAALGLVVIVVSLIQVVLGAEVLAQDF